jgi:RNA polymerase sigma-70 factor (ECF subfamily)
MGSKSSVAADARFSAIVEEYGRILRNTIVRLCPKDLGIQFDDVEQEARLRLWRALASEREIADPASYIYKVAATATIDAVRRVKVRREEQIQLGEEDDPEPPGIRLPANSEKSPEREAERQQVIRKVERALSQLAENRRRAVGLYLQELTTQEIADILGWTEAKARNLVYRGLEDLRRQLRAEGVDYEIG